MRKNFIRIIALASIFFAWSIAVFAAPPSYVNDFVSLGADVDAYAVFGWPYYERDNASLDGWSEYVGFESDAWYYTNTPPVGDTPPIPWGHSPRSYDS